MVNLKGRSFLKLLDFQTESNVVIDGHGGKESIALENNADISVFNRNIRHISSINDHLSFGRFYKPGDGT